MRFGDRGCNGDWDREWDSFVARQVAASLCALLAFPSRFKTMLTISVDRADLCLSESCSIPPLCPGKAAAFCADVRAMAITVRPSARVFLILTEVCLCWTVVSFFFESAKSNELSAIVVALVQVSVLRALRTASSISCTDTMLHKVGMRSYASQNVAMIHANIGIPK